jgi:PAS domain S-box-containing protein
MARKATKVLLVEDDAGDADILQEMLKARQGPPFDVEWVDHLSNGLARLGQGGIDVVLLDLSLPDSQGMGTFEKVHAKAPTVPVVVLTGLDDEEMASKAVARGAQDYLVKGDVDKNLLFRALRYAIERNHAEQALRESEEKYRLMYNNALVAMYTTTLKDSTVVAVNNVGVRMFGYSSQEEFISDFKAADHYADPGDREAIAKSLKEKGEVQRQCGFLRKDGSYIWSEFYARVYVEKHWVESCAMDITGRKKAEEALTHSEEKLQNALEKLRLSHEALSTPVIQVWDHILALPLIGLMDDVRAQRVMEVLLRKIVETQSELVILDVTGVGSMDTQVANHLIQTMQSSSLLGAQCVLTGIRPEIAQSVLGLGFDMSRIAIRRDMQDGLRWALEKMGYEVRNGGDGQQVLSREESSR